MRHQKHMTFAAAGLVFALFSAANAQNISGVSGAEVKAGDNSFEYRAGFSPENDGREESFAHRLHFQHAFDDSWRARLIVFQGKKGAQPLKTQSVGIEILHQFIEREESGNWDSGIRIDGLIPVEDGRPGRARIAWLNTVHFKSGWQARGNIYFNHAFGDRAPDGISIETREELTYKLPSGIRVGAQMFNYYNTTAHFGSFNEQRHQVGPIIKGKIGEHAKYELGALFGVSRAASDADIRLFISYAL